MRGKVAKALRRVAQARSWMSTETTARAIYKELKKMYKRKV